MMPRFTVVYPEFDVRGRISEHLLNWTATQTLDRARYRLVVVLSPGSVEEAAVCDLLNSGDQLIFEATNSDTAKWNAGAEAADTPWVVLVEAHSPGKPDCLAALDQWLDTEPESAAGNFVIGHPDDYLMAKLSDRWFGEQIEKWSEDWPRLHRAGHAIRRDVFLKLGGYGDFGQFGPPLLSARFLEAGYSMETLENAVVTHIDDLDLRGHHVDTIDFVRGECAARVSEEALFFEQYFGHNRSFRNRLTTRPQFVLRMIEAMFRYCVRGHRLPEEVKFGFLALLGNAWTQSSLNRALAGCITHVEEAVLLILTIPQEWRYRWFVKAHRRVVETSARNWVGENPCSKSDGFSPGVFPIETIGPCALAGVHALECWNERPFRWSEPFLTLRFSGKNSVECVRIDTGGLRGDPRVPIIFMACGASLLEPTAAHILENGVLEIRIPRKLEGQARQSGLNLAINPLPVSEQELPDGRKLGLPIFSVEVV